MGRQAFEIGLASMKWLGEWIHAMSVFRVVDFDEGYHHRANHRVAMVFS
jgi:hypothetical protein